MATIQEIQQKQKLILAGLRSLTDELKQLQEQTETVKTESSVNSEYMTDSEFMRLLNISKSSFYNWKKSGRVNVIELARGKCFIKRTEVQRLIEEAERKSA